MRNRWPLLLAFVAITLAQNNDTVLGLNQRLKPTSSLVQTPSPVTEEAYTVNGGYGDKTCKKETVTITTGQYCPGPITSTAKTTITNTRTLTATVTDTKTSSYTTTLSLTATRTATVTDTKTSSYTTTCTTTLSLTKVYLSSTNAAL